MLWPLFCRLWHLPHRRISRCDIRPCRRRPILPLLICNSLGSFKTLEFHDHYRYVTTTLAAEHDPRLEISGLPDDARRAVYDITYFFYGYAMLRLFDVFDDQVFPILAHRVIAVW